MTDNQGKFSHLIGKLTKSPKERWEEVQQRLNSEAVLETIAWLKTLNFRKMPGEDNINAISITTAPISFERVLRQQAEKSEPISGLIKHNGSHYEITFEGRPALEYLARNGVRFPGSSDYISMQL